MNSKSFFYEFGRSIYRVDGFYAEYARKSKIKENLLWILYALNDDKEHSQKEICDSWDLPRSTVNTIMKELESNGYVALNQIKGEKRELNVSLTPKGKEYANTLLNDLYDIENKVFEKIKSTNVIDELNNIISELYKQEETIKNE